MNQHSTCKLSQTERSVPADGPAWTKPLSVIYGGKLSGVRAISRPYGGLSRLMIPRWHLHKETDTSNKRKNTEVIILKQCWEYSMENISLRLNAFE